MKVISISNQKGGVGKTTTALALASLLSRQGKTLLIDADPQGNATDTYGAKVEGEATLYDAVLDSDHTPILECVQHTELGDIVASDPLLRKADEVLGSDVEGVYRMADALSACEGTYDYVVIDTAPALNMLLYNCLVASNYVIIPMLADRYSITGISQLNDTVRAIRRRQNPNLEILGILLTKYGGRTNLSKSARTVLEGDAELMGTKLFNTQIRECVRCQEAQAQKTDLFEYAPSCTTAMDYQGLYTELEDMLCLH